ncbi:DUF2147 domain-containing protein [Flavivirga abyssicola]|uniref:DUF2147 domain-containing protein n=1 Tax=Flavivirga abyssicola TaxID=3063533 RepID=UPI0026DEBB2C|nr:DUF2147 domain-containing protein [Flavivirga sp. MEBiC07777]WVK13509.1 DUF2147 domain-containing protein [Flavivirga sp. MEBiC07777]
MLRLKKVVLFFCCFVNICAFSQDIFGKWKTIDDETKEAKSIVEIYKENDYVFGKIVEILNSDKKDALCEKCVGEEKDKPVLGLVLIKNMKPEGEYYKNGTIFDPERGKKYDCRLKLTNNPNILQVRGYISFFYATQYWERVN